MTNATDEEPALIHTPGPWDYDMDYIVAPDPSGVHGDIYIAEIAHSDDEGRIASPEQQDANRWLIAAAPDLLGALDGLINAIGGLPITILPGPFYEVFWTARKVVAKAGDPSTDFSFDIHAMLEGRHQIAVIWSIEDVQVVRSDLNDDQAWQVLTQCRRVHDCEVGFNWLLIQTVADDLFPKQEQGGGQ